MKSKNIAKTKIALAIPFAAAFLFFFTNSCEFAKTTNNNSIEKEIIASEDTVKVEAELELEGEIFYSVDVEPKFQGKEPDAFRPFIQENLKYPEEAQKQGIEGKVFVSFVIDKNGNVRNVKIERGVHSYLEEEAIRVVKLSPKWEPGKKDGKFVNVQYTFPISFALN